MKATDRFYSQKIHEISNWIGTIGVCLLSAWVHQGEASQADFENLYQSGLSFKVSKTEKVNDSIFHQKTKLPRRAYLRGSEKRKFVQNKPGSSNQVSINSVVLQKSSLPGVETEKTYSWFFDSIVTKQEMALVPTYFKSRIYGSKNWGLRFFTFSPDKTGYYGSFSVLNQFLKPYFRLQSLYRKDYSGDWKIYFTAEYSNYFHPWYGDGGKGVRHIVPREKTEKSRTDLYAHRIFINQKFLFKKYDPFFYGAGVSWIFRKEDLKKQKKRYFEDENFLFPTATMSYDSRNSWENANRGQYHQVSFGCALREDGACLVEGDFRFYFPVHSRACLAFRGFMGRSLFNELTYSMAYRLGGSKVLRGFAYNRFRGDNVYFVQSELRADLWKEILSGALFFELGEVSARGERFMGPRWDYGVGLRFGIPPSYKIKIRVDLGFPDKEIYNITVDFRQSF